VEHRIALQLEELLPGLFGRREWRTGPGTDLAHLRQLNQLVGGEPEPKFVAAGRHPQVVGPRLSRAYRAEQFAVYAFGCSSPLPGPGLRSKYDHEQILSKRLPTRDGFTSEGFGFFSGSAWYSMQKTSGTTPRGN
jgi:hypothetical protein